MKAIVYMQPNGILAVVHPNEGSRLAYSLTLDDGTVIGSEEMRPVDTFWRVWPVDGATADWAETEDEFVERIRDKDVPADAINVQIVDAVSIPTDRTFRDSWKAGANCVEIDMDKAREIHKTRLRALRAPKMAALDVAYMRADEAGDTAEKERVAKLKQALRDVTDDPGIVTARTPEELRRIMP